MGNSGLKPHYETASKTGVLKLSNHKLKEIPDDVLSLKSVLRNLDLSYNRLQDLPDELNHFKALKQLNVSNNKLQYLPETVGALTKLEMLNASHNTIVKIPASVKNLSSLKQVYLNNNKLKEFPLQFCGLKHLDLLDLSHNNITTIPSGISELYVIELNLNQNQVSVIADEISQCPKLKILRLEENCLTLEAVNLRLLRDSKIHTLVLDGNLFESKELDSLEGYKEYMERYTAMKKKMF